MFSIVIIAREQNENLDKCLKACGELYGDFEVIVNTDNERPQIKRHRGALQAKGEYIAFLDDDCEPKRDWLKNAEKYFEASWIIAVGGPSITSNDSNWKQRVSGKMLELGGVRHRFKPGDIFFESDLPFCNFIVRRYALLRCDNQIPYFPGEDTFICQQLMIMGKILYAPDVVVYHRRRPILIPLLKQIGGYGLHRGYFAKKYPRLSRKLKYALPSIVLLLSFGVFLWLYMVFVF